MNSTSQPLLQIDSLKKHFPVTQGFLNRVVGHIRAVDGVTFDVNPGECLGLVGESGSGKTTVGRCILRALNPTSGSVSLCVNDDTIDVAKASPEALKQLRRHMQMIFQDPYSSLNPRMTVLDIIGEPLLVNGVGNRQEREDRVRELLVQVGLKPQHLQRYPHAFSGGQRQRIGIARALALHPALIVADEPVSALDVSVQAQVLNLLQELQTEFSLTYLFVAHDLSVVRHISDRVAVMYAGRIVELAKAEELFHTPKHPYTEALLSAVPLAEPRRPAQRILLSGEVADPSNLPSGCVFHPRCAYARPECAEVEPQWEESSPGHFARCLFADSLELRGLGT